MPDRRSTTLIAAGVIAVLVVAGAVAGTASLSRTVDQRRTQRARPTTATVPATYAAPTPTSGYATAEQAARSAVPTGHVLELAEEAPDRQLFWAGPASSEWDFFITVERRNGSWTVTKTEPWSIDEAENNSTDAEDAPSAEGAPDAKALVEQFLKAIRQDRPGDARKLTIAPLHEDPASEQTSNGDFTSFTVREVQPRGDGAFWVLTTETWTYGTEKWRYDVVTAGSGLRIRNIEPAE